MNEEIARILQLLEDGKISADEAERLIKTLRTAGAATQPGDKHWKCGTRQEAPDIVRNIVRALRTAARRQRRIAWWRYYECARRLSETRRQRAGTQSVAERVRHALVHRSLADSTDVADTTLLTSDLAFDTVARELLLYALQDEFDIELALSDVERMATVGDIVAAVESRVGPSPAPEPPATPTTPPEPAAPETPPTPPEE